MWDYRIGVEKIIILFVVGSLKMRFLETLSLRGVL